MRKGDSAIHDPDARRIRALRMMEFRINHGASIREVAEKFNLSVHTVERELSYVKKARLLVEYEDKLVEELVPAAHLAILTALKHSDEPIKAAKIALEVFKGVVPGFKKQKPGADATQESELARYIASLQSGDESEGFIEGQTVPALPPAATEAAAQRSDGPAGGDAARLEPVASDTQSVGASGGARNSERA